MQLLTLLPSRSRGSSRALLSSAVVLLIFSPPSGAANPVNVLDHAPPGAHVDRTGTEDASDAFADAMTAANAVTAGGGPACLQIPAGTYRIAHNLPAFVGAGCVSGSGSTQSTIILDAAFSGDLFAWSEAWLATTPGPRVIGLRILGNPQAQGQQNALVFYDRNDNVFLDDVTVTNLPGRALYSGVKLKVDQAYMRESFLRALRFFNSGLPGVPVVEFSSEGSGKTDATNEIKISQIDIYGARGPSFVIRNNGSGHVRNITVESLRIEGKEDGEADADLLTLGDRLMTGNVSSISFTNLELIDPYPGHAAIRLTASPGAAAPYHIVVEGMIDGGVPRGEGLRIDAGRSSMFRFRSMNTRDTNVVIGPGVSHIVLDGGGRESKWTYRIHPSSAKGILTPQWRVGDPAMVYPTVPELDR